MVTVVCGLNAGSVPSVGVAAIAHSGSLITSHDVTRSLLGLALTWFAKGMITLLISADSIVGLEMIGARLCGGIVAVLKLSNEKNVNWM